jgi:hypothetical protein
LFLIRFFLVRTRIASLLLEVWRIVRCLHCGQNWIIEAVVKGLDLKCALLRMVGRALLVA